MRVLLVEDDATAAQGMTMFLRNRGLVVEAVGNGEETLELLKHYDYDIVLLDLMLPDMDGYEVIRRMRNTRQETPVLILSGLTRPEAKVKGFGLGADDYISKPCDTDELLARMLAIVRRNKGYSEPTLQVGPLTLNLNTRGVSVNGTPLHVTAKEYSVLELLVLRKGMVQTKEAFLNHLYGGMDEPEVKIIDVFICKLRKKLLAAGAGGMIKTAWSRGYILHAPRPAPGASAQLEPEARAPGKPEPTFRRPLNAILRSRASAAA